MPEYTENYGLAKPYEVENYDINVQNTNMDIIDTELKAIEDEVAGLGSELESHKEDYATYKDSNNLKIAKIEKDINDYQQTMASMNVNQEAKQKATGYGTVSLPPNAANGQVGVSVKGNTYTQILEIDQNDWRNSFTAYGDSEITQNSAIIRGNYSHRIELKKAPNYRQGRKYGILINATPSLHVHYSGIGKNIMLDSNGIGKQIFDYAELQVPETYTRFWSSANPIITKLIIIELDTQSEWDFNNLTNEELNKKYIYVSGTKSTVSAMRLKSVGKNLCDNIFKKKGSSTIVEDMGDYYSVQTSTNAYGLRKIFDSLTPNTAYTFSFEYQIVEAVDDSIVFRVWNVTKNEWLLAWSISGTSRERIRVYTTFTTPEDNDTLELIVSQGLLSSTDNPFIFNVWKTAQLEEGSTATPYEPYTESNIYIPNVGELRSLPNGTKDEIRLSEKKFIQRTKKYVLQASDIVSVSNYDEFTIVTTKPFTDYVSTHPVNAIDGTYVLEGYPEQAPEASSNFTSANVGYSYNHGSANTQALRIIMPADTTLAQAQTALTGLELTYQLAEPIITPIQVSGTLLSNPSGTVYVEPVVADAGIYDEGISVLHQDLPIDYVEKLSRVDFTTGLETELEVSTVIINEDKKGFTHPELEDGDIVFFSYFYDRESTLGETEIEYYDSRYVIKDSVTDKFYKWQISVADGVPSIKLVEV